MTGWGRTWSMKKNVAKGREEREPWSGTEGPCYGRRGRIKAHNALKNEEKKQERHGLAKREAASRKLNGDKQGFQLKEGWVWYKEQYEWIKDRVTESICLVPVMMGSFKSLSTCVTQMELERRGCATSKSRDTTFETFPQFSIKGAEKKMKNMEYQRGMMQNFLRWK